MFKRFWEILCALIFPPRCVGCRAEGALFCVVCAANVQLLTAQTCPACHAVSAGGATCRACRQQFPLTGLRVAASYAVNPGLARAVKQLKYKFSSQLANSLGDLLTQTVALKQFAGTRVVCAVPLATARLRWRGFNQAELLAGAVAKDLQLSTERLLIRTKNTAPQAKLGRAARLTNLTGAFALAPNAVVAGKTVILVDDVASTGSTLIECARVLRAAGAVAVWGLVLARN